MKDLTYSNGELFAVLKNKGVILLENATKATEVMLEALANIFLRLEINEPINVLTDDQCNELLNWDAEKFRKSVQNLS